MQSQPFYFELEDQLKSFCYAINGAICTRYDKNRNAHDGIQLRYVEAAKQRAIHDLTNKAQHITLPVMAYWVSNIVYDKNRVFNKHEGSSYSIKGKRVQLPQPLPVNLTINVSFLTKYYADLDQIISNLVTYFQPYIVVSWARWGLSWADLRSKIIWSGSITKKDPIDINDNTPTRFECDTSFVMEAWLFKHDTDTNGIIRTIEANLTAIEDINKFIINLYTPELSASVLSASTDPTIPSLTTETVVISGQPHPTATSPTIISVNTPTELYVYGTFYRSISTVYLSSNSAYDPLSSTFVNPFSAFPTLSADNPGFEGFEIPATYINETTIKVEIPPSNNIGYADIIITNPVGYGKISNIGAIYSSGIPIISA